MKKSILILFLALICQLAVSQQGGIVKKSIPFESKILGKNIAYSIYLPSDYAKFQRSFPVLYLLHGRTGNENDWLESGELEAQIEKAITAELLPPMVIIMPQAFNSYYLDSYDGDLPYETYFFEEFIPLMEERYRIRSEKKFRAIAGLSMGGYGALHYCLRHPDVFGACGALSAAVYTDKAMASMARSRYEEIYAPLYGRGLKGKTRLSETWKSYSPFHLMKAQSRKKLKQTAWYLDCGDDDYLNEANTRLHLQMLEQQIPHEFRVSDGKHDWDYWQMALVPCLTYICRRFKE